MEATIHKNLNSYQRRNLYLECEAKGLTFERKRVWEEKWICRKHKKILIAVDDAWCSDICCLKCPINDCWCDADGDQDFKLVKTKLKIVIVYE